MLSITENPMQKTILLFLLIILSAYKVTAQTTDTMVYNRYLDLNVAILEDKPDEAITIAESIMPDTASLPAKTRISFYSMAGKLYEDSEPAKAIKLYLKVAAAVPNYYVVHRALGYLYLKEAEELEKKLNTSPDKKQARTNYINAVKKVLPHLEKAQACDPSPETLEVITSLYKKINDNAGLNALNNRLKERGKTCVDILEAQ